MIHENVAELLFDGLNAFKKGSPNMNSLVGFGSIAAFIISSVRFGLKFECSVKLLDNRISDLFELVFAVDPAT